MHFYHHYTSNPHETFSSLMDFLFIRANVLFWYYQPTLKFLAVYGLDS